MARYAKKLTKEDLMKGGIVEITSDCKIFGKNGEIPIYQKHNQGYMTITIYDIDEEGNRIKVPITRMFKGSKNPCNTYIYKTRVIGLHRAMWAWHYGEVPEGMVVDHVNNRHTNLEDYHLSNLQLLTQKENVAKERTNWNMYELKCKLNKPRSFYEAKLAAYETKYEKAKEDGDAELCHKLRSNISQVRARIRYWDNHKDEYWAYLEAKNKETNDKQIWRLKVALRKKMEERRNFFRESGDTEKWRLACRMLKELKTASSKQILEVCEKVGIKLNNVE
jgi:hypothetical protein